MEAKYTGKYCSIHGQNVGTYFQCWRSILLDWYPVISDQNCCRHSISDFGHGQKKQMTLKRVHNTRRREPKLTGDTRKFCSGSGEPHSQIVIRCVSTLPDLHSKKSYLNKLAGCDLLAICWTESVS